MSHSPGRSRELPAPRVENWPLSERALGRGESLQGLPRALQSPSCHRGPGVCGRREDVGQDFCPCVGVAATAWRLLRGQVTSCVASGGREASTVFSVIDDVGRGLFLLKAPPPLHCSGSRPVPHLPGLLCSRCDPLGGRDPPRSGWRTDMKTWRRLNDLAPLARPLSHTVTQVS